MLFIYLFLINLIKETQPNYYFSILVFSSHHHGTQSNSHQNHNSQLSNGQHSSGKFLKQQFDFCFGLGILLYLLINLHLLTESHYKFHILKIKYLGQILSNNEKDTNVTLNINIQVS